MADYATLLRDHVTLTCRCIDRVFIQAWVPKLQSVGQVCLFLRWQRKFKIPSSAAFKAIGDRWVRDVERYAEQHAIPVVHFAKGQNKEDYARPLIDAAAAEGGDGRVVLIGIAQEKASAWKSWKAKGQEQRAHPHMEWGRQMIYVNHYYFITFTSGTRSGDRPSGRRTRTRHGRSGSTSTGTSGPSGSWRKLASATPRSTTAFPPARTRGRCNGSATGSVPARSRASSGAGSPDCLRLHPGGLAGRLRL